MNCQNQNEKFIVSSPIQKLYQHFLLFFIDTEELRKAGVKTSEIPGGHTGKSFSVKSSQFAIQIHFSNQYTHAGFSLVGTIHSRKSLLNSISGSVKTPQTSSSPTEDKVQLKDSTIMGNALSFSFPSLQATFFVF